MVLYSSIVCIMSTLSAPHFFIMDNFQHIGGDFERKRQKLLAGIWKIFNIEKKMKISESVNSDI
jgi:hypothetical protein